MRAVWPEQLAALERGCAKRFCRPHALSLSRPHALPRRGVTLLEVIVAMAIFLLSLVAIWRLISLGNDRALDIYQQGEALELCQSKLAEVAAGAEPLEAQTDVPFEHDANWHWSLEPTEGEAPNLWSVTVRVWRQRGDGSRAEITLTQMVLDPAARGGMPGAEAADAASSTTPSSSSSATTPAATSP